MRCRPRRDRDAPVGRLRVPRTPRPSRSRPPSPCAPPPPPNRAPRARGADQRAVRPERFAAPPLSRGERYRAASRRTGDRERRKAIAAGIAHSAIRQNGKHAVADVEAARSARGWRRKRILTTILLAGVAPSIWLALAPAANAASCPQVVNPAHFASKAQLHKLTAKFNSFGPRILGSPAHNKAIDWLEDKARGIGLRVHSEPFRPYTWLPRTHFKHRPGLDIGAAGGLSVTKPDGSRVNVPDAGAVHWSKPTSKGRAGPRASSSTYRPIRRSPLGTLPARLSSATSSSVRFPSAL